MIKPLLLFLLFPFFLTTAAQQNGIHISGTVTDSLNKVIPDAIVSLVRLNNNAGILFVTTDQNGIFHIDSGEPFQPQSLAIKVTCAGFLKQDQILVKATEQLKFRLQSVATAYTLPGVVIISKQRPIVQKSDTLNYDAGTFTEKSDRHLGDLIKKLPGVEVDENGNIKYQGKAINQFYIEGDNLLDQRYTIATDNINIADVDKVQVIEHNQHVKMLNGIIPSDRAAINILLKNKSRLKLLNNLEATGGLPSTYNLEGKSMAFKTKFKAINALKLNNSGFDYSGETGTSGLQGPEGISRNRALYNQSQLFSANNLVKLNPYMAIKINGSYNKEDQQTSNQLASTYYLPKGDGISYNESNHDHYKAAELRFNADLNINSPKNYLNVSTNFLRQQLTSQGNTDAGNTEINRNNTHTTTQFGTTLSGYFMIRKKQILNYENNFTYSDHPQLLLFTPGILPTVLNDSIPYLQTSQHQQLKNFINTSQLSYNKVVHNWTLGLNAGLMLQSQQLYSSVSLTQQNNRITAPEGFGNAIQWKRNELSTGATLAYNGYKSILVLALPVSWQHYQYKNDSVITNRARGTRLVFQPSCHWEYKLGIENAVYLDYNLAHKTAGIQQIYGGAIISGYRDFASYETPYLMSRSHTVSGGLNYKRVIKAFFANLNLTYTATKNYFLYSTTLQNNMTLIKALSIPNYSNTTAVAARISKYIFVLNTTIAADGALNITRAQVLQNAELFTVYSTVRTAGLSVTPTVLKWLQLVINGNYKQYSTLPGQSGLQQQSVHQWNLHSGITFYPFTSFSISFANNYYQSQQVGNAAISNIFIDGYLQYKPEKEKFLCRLSCTNMANVRSYKTLNVSSNSISATSYSLRPRTVSLMVSFDF